VKELVHINENETLNAVLIVLLSFVLDIIKKKFSFEPINFFQCMKQLFSFFLILKINKKFYMIYKA
jgi:hypothetical protein